MTFFKISSIAIKLLSISVLISFIQTKIFSDDGYSVYKEFPRILQSVEPNPPEPHDARVYDSFHDNYYVYTGDAWKYINIIIVLYIFISFCCTWYSQITKPKLFIHAIGLFTGRKLVD